MQALRNSNSIRQTRYRSLNLNWSNTASNRPRPAFNRFKSTTADHKRKQTQNGENARSCYKHNHKVLLRARRCGDEAVSARTLFPEDVWAAKLAWVPLEDGDFSPPKRFCFTPPIRLIRHRWKALGPATATMGKLAEDAKIIFFALVPASVHTLWFTLVSLCLIVLVFD